jgi:hypothetical protein
VARLAVDDFQDFGTFRRRLADIVHHLPMNETVFWPHEKVLKQSRSIVQNAWEQEMRGVIFSTILLAVA